MCQHCPMLATSIRGGSIDDVIIFLVIGSDAGEITVNTPKKFVDASFGNSIDFIF